MSTRKHHMKIGLIGLGRMGMAVARRLNACGCSVTAWDRNAAAVEAAVAAGVRTASGPQAIVADADFVISIITEDNGVRALFEGPEGFLSTDVKGKLFIEMSTLQPATTRALAPIVAAKGARLVEAPVMGSIPTVRDGQLLVLAAGDVADIQRASAVIDHLARRVVHMGPHGSALAMKLAVNLAMASYLQALAEATALGTAHGLALEKVLDILLEAPTATPWLKGKLDIFKGGRGDVSLDIRTIRKDVMSAVATGALAGVPMPATSGVLTSLSAAVAGGWGDKDLAEIPKYFRDHLLQVYD
jgi:3-hydroxyisobutyrate dehydrogenase-like beta-hydroxyacid dehydrogenase